MYFANPWGLLALLAIPAILTIHLYRRRYPPLVVAGLHLWSSEKRANPAGRRRTRLPLSTSLILELLAALFLALALADPRFGRVENARHLIAVLDDSASMQGRPPEAGAASFRDAALAALSHRVNAMPIGSRVTLLLTGTRPVTLAGPAVSWIEAQRALEHWKPSLPRHAFEPAWDAALQLRDQSGGELLFITDRKQPDDVIPPQMEVVAVGTPLTNVGITSANWSFQAAKRQGLVFIQVRNYEDKPTRATVIGSVEKEPGKKVEVFRREMPLGADSTSSLDVPVPGGLGKLTVSVEAPRDGLPVDNVVDLVEPQIRTVKAAIDFPAGRTRQLFERALRAVPDVEITKTDGADLVAAPVSTLPTANTRAWWLGVGPVSSTEADRKQARNLVGPYLLDRRHPLLQGITLAGVIWGGVQPLKFDVLPLVSAGQYPLLSQWNRRRGFVGVLNIDLDRSNLGETPDWPILVQNLVEMRRADLPGLQRWNYHLGENVQFRLFEDDSEQAARRTGPLELRRQGGEASKSILRTGLIELPELLETGVYEVKDGETAVGRFAVNFQDAEESNLRELSSGTHPPREPVVKREIEVDSPYTWALLVGLTLITVALLANWRVLGQERRVAA